MLASLFLTIKHPAAVVGYGLFLADFVKFGNSRGMAKQSATFCQIAELVPLYLATSPFALKGIGFILVSG